jgi:hypothetical protein
MASTCPLNKSLNWMLHYFYFELRYIFHREKFRHKKKRNLQIELPFFA